MEERASPAGDGNDDPPIKSNHHHPRTPEKSTETYVIRIPRDQVYRVPPPENAHIVESYRKPFHESKGKCGGRLIFICLAIILVGFGIFVTLDILSKPKSPEFSIIRFNKKSSKSSNHHPILEYEISMQVTNPNEKINVHYGVGNWTLDFKGHKIANGGSHSIGQEAGESIKLNETLNGTKEELPSWIEKSMSEKVPKVLILKINIPIEIEAWGKTLKKELIVGCDLEVDKLAEGAKILSQKCATDSS